MKYADIIREYSKNTYVKMIRNAQGELKYPFVVPGSARYNNCLWDWDSWLSNVAIRQIMADNDNDGSMFYKYEKGCILNFLNHIERDGRIPIAISPDGVPPMFDTKDSNIHKPCLVQHIAFILRQNEEKYEWLLPVWDKIELYINCYLNNFKHKETGLFFWKNDFAIGVDNDPCTFYRPEKSSASIFLNCMMYKELIAASYVCRLIGKDDKLYKSKTEKLKNAVNEHLWDEKCGFYFSADLNLLPIDREGGLHSGMPRHWNSLIQRIDVWSGFMAMWAGIADERQAKRMVRENMMNPETFNAEYGTRTLSKLEKMYCVVKSDNPSCWLGPVWGISNYMCFKALADYGFDEEAKTLAEKTIKLFGKDLLQTGDLHEYYNPDTGEGVNNPGFQNWNLLVNNMIARIEGRKTAEEF